jgi:hypothetical protein
MPLALDIQERVATDFPRRDIGPAIALLEAFGGRESQRVLRCVVHLSDGSLERLHHYLRSAEVDYRDVILFAEYDQQNHRIHDFSFGFN